MVISIVKFTCDPLEMDIDLRIPPPVFIYQRAYRRDISVVSIQNKDLNITSTICLPVLKNMYTTTD